MQLQVFDRLFVGVVCLWPRIPQKSFDAPKVFSINGGKLETKSANLRPQMDHDEAIFLQTSFFRKK